MAFAPLILRGNQKINDTSVADQVTTFKFNGARDTITIPTTFGKKKSFAAGDDEYEVEIAFLQDVDPTAISMILWDALDDEEGTIEVSGTMRSGAVSATNPMWTATAVVTAAALGGEVQTVGQDSVTFKLTGRPVKATTDD